MNKITFIAVTVFFISILLMTNTKVNAQNLGADDDTLEKIFIGLKKINSRLENLEAEELGSLKSHLENIEREIEEVKYALPQLQGMVEQNTFETLNGLNSTNAKLKDLQAEVKNQVLDKLHELIQSRMSLGEVVGQINAQNKRLEDTNSIFRSELIPVIQKDMKTLKESMILEDEKFNKLIDLLAKLAIHSAEMEKSVMKTAEDQQKIKEALADIRRKANVNIFRNDEIMKILRQLRN
jgi:hypothetical protein